MALNAGQKHLNEKNTFFISVDIYGEYEKAEISELMKINFNKDQDPMAAFSGQIKKNIYSLVQKKLFGQIKDPCGRISHIIVITIN